MKHAVFFRNVNLGRPNCPSKTQLEQAFLDAGAADAASFLVNGTLVFSAAAARSGAVLKDAVSRLQAVCGLREPAFLRRVDELAALVAADPFAGVDRSTVYECCITFLSPRSAPLDGLPLQTPRGDLSILAATTSEAFSLSYKPGKTPGSPNAFLEKTLGLPATTRAWNTIVRLVAKHA